MDEKKQKGLENNFKQKNNIQKLMEIKRQNEQKQKELEDKIAKKTERKEFDMHKEVAALEVSKSTTKIIRTSISAIILIFICSLAYSTNIGWLKLGSLIFSMFYFVATIVKERSKLNYLKNKYF